MTEDDKRLEEWWTHPECFSEWILVGESAKSKLESDIDEFLGGEINSSVEKMWFDTYDGSIELCLSADLKYDPETLRAKLAEYGFTYGWWNFSDGTEQHFGQGRVYERKPVPRPRWDENRRSKEYLGIDDSRPSAPSGGIESHPAQQNAS